MLYHIQRTIVGMLIPRVRGHEINDLLMTAETICDLIYALRANLLENKKEHNIRLTESVLFITCSVYRD